MLEKLRGRANTLSPCESSLPAQVHWPQAAVLLAMTDDPINPEIILTQRAQHLSTHSGEVSFPGGKLDEVDRSLRETALRESWEEIGLDPLSVEVLGQLPSVHTLWKYEVTTIVGIVPTNAPLTANLGEIDSIFKVPVKYFLTDQRTRTDRFQRGDVDFWAPVYHYEGYEIWGFTAGILVNFLNQIYDAGIEADSSDAPVKIFS